MPDQGVPIHRRLFRLLKAAADEFGQDTAGRAAAALAFYTLFSLVPLLFLVVAMVGFVSSESVLTAVDCDTVSVSMIPSRPTNPLDRAIVQVDEVAGRQVSDQIARLACSAGANPQSALWIGIGLAAFGGSSIFLQVQGVLNKIFGVPQKRVSGIGNLLTQRGVALGAAVVLAILVLAPLVAVVGVNFINNLVDVTWLRRLLSVVVPLTSLLILVMVVSMTFRWLTRAGISWRAAVRGGLFTSLVGLAGAYLVGTYLQSFGTSGALGAIGGAAILLFFFNLMWMIYLFGAEVTKVYADFLVHGDVMSPTQRRAAPPIPPPDREPESGLRTGLVAFAIGLFTGWAARRRRP